MKYKSTLLAVHNIKAAVDFYKSVLNLSVTDDFGENVVLNEYISLQEIDSWKNFVNKEEDSIVFGANNSELYFEEENMDEFLQKLKAFNINYLCKPATHSWGQRVVRFYDTDNHIIEVGESMHRVVKGFLDSGLTPTQTAKRMDVSIEYIEKMR